MRNRLTARTVAQVLFGAALTLATVGLSRVPWSAEPGEHAVLRLAWRHRAELVEHCRRLSPQELERLPRHMRRETECARALGSWKLEVELDETDLVDDSVAARGARSDRPLSVFRELALTPGMHRLEISFRPYAGQSAPMKLDTAVVVQARSVVLVTLDGDPVRLVVRRPP